MFFTLFYMYATFLQWWRLGSLKNKLNGTLNSQNALLVCNENVIFDNKTARSFENLLFRCDDRIGCTVVPKQKINLSQWLTFPKDNRLFPIYFSNPRQKIEYPNIYILVQAILETYVKHSAEILQVENFGELVAWKVTDHFEAILKTDMDKLTKLVHCYSHNVVDINHELKLLKIETVDVDGMATKIKYDKKFSQEDTLKYSHAPVHWKTFVDSVKEIYSKIRDTTNPKITIENGAAKPDDVKKVPVSEVKPIKKDSKKAEDKNTLEVSCSDYRRHKSKEKNSGDKHTKTETKTEKQNKVASKTKEEKVAKDDKEKHHHHKREDESKKDTTDVAKAKEDTKKIKDNLKKEHHKKTATEDKTSTKVKDHKKEKIEKAKTKRDLEMPEKSTDKSVEEKTKESKGMNKRTTSSEKKLMKSAAVCEDPDTEPGKSKKEINGNSKPNDKEWIVSKGTKPPNILVYADSVVAKDNVKSVLTTMLNSEKYTIYDLPTNPKHMVWDGSTVLVVVCGSVSPNLTFYLLQYLLNGGQLLCLCSDLLYSVLSSFSTAEVREHELVRFTYGKWKQVRMMHHIFCYQASPAKKQFSKDSDHSNQSSGNGSSPIAPRTPSAVEIHHNGKEFIIQVQVLGTEETWQTPSLLLATVKNGDGRAIFSQVHLEVSPNQYEDDESKFEALKDSDQARMEILRDILSNHLDIDCTSPVDVAYSPAYFLGRHDQKLKFLSECDSIKDNQMLCDSVTVKLCGKDEKADPPSKNFLPIFIHSCPSNFSTVNYFEALETEHIGRLVLYCDVLASSQSLIRSTILAHGLVVIPRQQTHGTGRSANVWISPVGSAAFSVQLHIPLESPLGKVLPLTQLLVMVGIVSAIKKFKGHQDLNIGIKWPNDLYADGKVKIGGLVAHSFTSDKVGIVNIGCGVNLDNPNPTTCINDLIRTSNMDKGTTMPVIPYEAYFAAAFNEIEKVYNKVQSGDMDYFLDLYYKYWLHSDTNVTVTSKDGETKKAKVSGIDEFGFLKVTAEDGVTSVVQPDGNSFDMLRGLISPKSF